MGPRELLAACHANLVEAVGSIARSTPAGQLEEHGGVTIARSGIASPVFNVVFALEPPRSLEGLEARIEEVLVSCGVPWTLMATAATAGAVAPIARAFGLEPGDPIPGMIWEPLPSSPPAPPDGVGVRRLEKAQEVPTFVRTMMQGFDAPPELLIPWADGLQAGAGRVPDRLGLYLGEIDRRPVATALRYVTPGIAGIYAVATLPEFRRRGIGAALTARAAIDGRADGCVRSFLQSTAMGRSVYEKLGYRWVEEYREWFSVPRPRG